MSIADTNFNPDRDPNPYSVSSGLSDDEIKRKIRGWLAEEGSRWWKGKPIGRNRYWYYLVTPGMPKGTRKAFPIVPGRPNLLEEVLQEQGWEVSRPCHTASRS